MPWRFESSPGHQIHIHSRSRQSNNHSDTIRAAKPKAGQAIKLSDGGGLQLWVQPSGSKLWNLAYRFAGKQRKLAIGSYPGIGLKEARAKREEAKRLLASGFDPSQQKRLGKLASESQKADTFEAISREVLEKKRREGRSETTPPSHLLEIELVRDEFEERAAIMEIDGGLSREEAEREAWALVSNLYRQH